MAIVVHKETFEIHPDVQKRRLPRSARILHVAEKSYRIVVWYERQVEDKEFDDWQFYVIPTGTRLGRDDFFHLGSVLLQDGALVFHLYAINEGVEKRNQEAQEALSEVLRGAMSSIHDHADPNGPPHNTPVECPHAVILASVKDDVTSVFKCRCCGTSIRGDVHRTRAYQQDPRSTLTAIREDMLTITRPQTGPVN